MQQQEQVVPAMRFSGFTEDWKCQFLETTSSLKGGFAFPSSEMSTFEQGYQLIKMSNLYSGVLDLSRNPSYWSHLEPNHEGYLIKDGDILITLTGTFGKKDFGYTVLMQNPKNLLLNQRVALIRPKKGYSPNFLANLFKTSKFDREFHRLAIGGTGNQANVSINDCRKIRLLIPSNEEQQKIAAFLRAVDEKIAQLQKKKDLLEEYKKSCMQKLFSQELRFTDDNGNTFPDWEEIEIGKFGSVRTSSVDKLSKDGEKPAKLLNYMDVYRRDHITPNDKFQDITAPDGQFTASNLKEGDILFTPSSETPTDIGHSAVVTEDLPNVLFSYHLMRFRPKKGVLLPSFSGYAFKSHAFYVELWKRAQGATRYTISKAAVEESKVRYPKSLDEQKKIADFLSAVDDKISLVAEELDKAKTFKNGLLQQMFV